MISLIICLHIGQVPMLVLNKAITLKYIVAKITSYVQSCLKCFMVYLLSYCWQEKVAQLLLYSIHLSNRSFPLLGYQYTPLIKAPKPAPSILCCNTQVNTIKQLLYYQETLYCVGAHYYVMQEAWHDVWNCAWPLRAVILRNNGHHKDGSKLKLWEHSAYT